MYDRTRLVDLVEHELDRHPVCPACHAPTEVADEAGALVLRCPVAASATGVLARVRAAVLPHLHLVLLEREELLAA